MPSIFVIIYIAGIFVMAPSAMRYILDADEPSYYDHLELGLIAMVGILAGIAWPFFLLIRLGIAWLKKNGGRDA